jgi:hypothetical protein
MNMNMNTAPDNPRQPTDWRHLEMGSPDPTIQGLKKSGRGGGSRKGPFLIKNISPGGHFGALATQDHF